MFLAKLIQLQFQYTASSASILYGVIAGAAALTGNLSGEKVGFLCMGGGECVEYELFAHIISNQEPLCIFVNAVMPKKPLDIKHCTVFNSFFAC